MLFWRLYVIIAILVRLKHGSPVLFTQDRPGYINPKIGKEVIFKLYKFRSMTYARDKNGNLHADKVNEYQPLLDMTSSRYWSHRRSA